MAISTTARRTARAKDIDTALEDLVIDLEDACVNLPLTEQEGLLKKVRAALSGVTADPAGIASGRVPLSLGAGAPAPTVAAGTPDPQQAVIDFAASKGFDPTKLAQLFAAIDDATKLDDAIKAALGQMMPSADLATANGKLTVLETRLNEVENETGVSANALRGNDWKAKLTAAIAAKISAATPAPAGLDAAKKAAVKKVIDAIKAGKKSSRSDKRSMVLSDADLNAADAAIA